MSFIDDNNIHAEYTIGVSERFDTASQMTDKELAEMLIENEKLIDDKFKEMTLDIAKKVIDRYEITSKQRHVLEKAYVYNFEIDRDYY